MSRATVRKVLRSGATSFSYERRTQPRPKIGPWQSELDGILSENAARPKRERLTLMRIFEDLRSRGYEGGYDAVRRHAARWRVRSGQAVLSFRVLQKSGLFDRTWSDLMAARDAAANENLPLTDRAIAA